LVAPFFITFKFLFGFISAYLSFYTFKKGKRTTPVIKMKNWAIQGLLYDLNPSPSNYIKFKWHHFYFCKKDDPTIIAALYLDNLVDEVRNEIVELKSVNKKSLTLAVIKKILENNEAQREMIALFENKQADLNEAIKQFLNKVSSSINYSPGPSEDLNKDATTAEFPVRTYLIATDIYLEINHNELHYETLVRDITALKEFITAKFGAQKISGRITDMKSFSYKKILSGKSNEGAKGQLKPQIKQIAFNPSIFGKDVSAFAQNILKEHFE
jgi:hypothetical protein